MKKGSTSLAQLFEIHKKALYSGATFETLHGKAILMSEEEYDQQDAEISRIHSEQARKRRKERESDRIPLPISDEAYEDHGQGD